MSGHLERVSGFVPRWPGLNLMTILNPDRKVDHQACLLNKICVIQKYSKYSGGTSGLRISAEPSEKLISYG